MLALTLILVPSMLTVPTFLSPALSCALHEGFLEKLAVLATEGADGGMAGMQVAAADVANHHVFVGGILDHPRREAPRGVAIDEQGKHHAGWILFVARSALVGTEVFGGEPVYRADDEMNDVIIAHPVVAQIRRQEHRGVPVETFKPGSHGTLLKNKTDWHNLANIAI